MKDWFLLAFWCSLPVTPSDLNLQAALYRQPFLQAGEEPSCFKPSEAWVSQSGLIIVTLLGIKARISSNIWL